MVSKKRERDDYDSPWKMALGLYLRHFFEFFFPSIEGEIDWSRQPEFLEQELRKMQPDSQQGHRESDALVKVYRVDGMEAWVLIHIEVQAQWDADFALRMFVSHYRIFDRHDKPICSLAILADTNPKWCPSSYSTELWGTKASLEFCVAKLHDYRPQLAQLETSRNPFALVVAATLHAQDNGPRSPARREAKFSLTRALLGSGRSRAEIRDLYTLVDWVLGLSPDQEQQFLDRVKTYAKENRSMPHITDFERHAERKERLRALKVVLEARFGTLPAKLSENLNALSAEQLNELLPMAATEASLDRFTARVSQAPSF